MCQYFWIQYFFFSMDPELRRGINKDLKVQLHKTLSALKALVTFYLTMEDKCKPSLEKLLNLTDQYICCRQVPPAELPQKVDFADVKIRLLHKISLAIDTEVDCLKKCLSQYEVHSSRLGKYYDYCMVHYQKNYQPDDVHDLTTRSATVPAVTDMLEWIEECSRLCHERCMCKMYLIDSFNPDQDDICETFLQQWKDGDQTMVNKFEECIGLSSGFIDEEVT